jgi:hypothetical protein
VRRFVFAVIFMIIGSAPVLADVRIVSSLGGSVGSYLSFFSRVRQSGERVIIDGPCLSACTLVSAYPPRVRSWISRHGGLTNNVILLRGSELTAFYPRCRR